MSECLQAYVGLRYMCLVGLPLPHSDTEYSLEQTNSVLQQHRPTCLSLSVRVLAKLTKKTKPF